MSEIVSEFKIDVQQVDGYQFRVEFDDKAIPPLTMDEPAPLGTNVGPNPSRVLASALGSCLSMSLLFCFSKSRIEVKGMRAQVTMQMVRNEQKRLRVGRAEVVITPELADEDKARAARCRELFADFCTVSQSIRHGIDLDVKVAGLED